MVSYFKKKEIVMNETQIENMVFSLEDRINVRFTSRQVYEQAAMVYRTNFSVPENVPVYSPGTYNSRDETPKYTMAEMSRTVDALVRTLARNHFNYV